MSWLNKECKNCLQGTNNLLEHHLYILSSFFSSVLVYPGVHIKVVNGTAKKLETEDSPYCVIDDEADSLQYLEMEGTVCEVWLRTATHSLD